MKYTIMASQLIPLATRVLIALPFHKIIFLSMYIGFQYLSYINLSIQRTMYLSCILSFAIQTYFISSIHLDM